MTGPLVSVITPTYRHESYIDACVRSVLGQTYRHWEQIVIDDGSPDGTAERAARWRDERVRLEVQGHRGIWRLAETYNHGLSLARGDLIAILEGDDYWPADKLATLVPCFQDPRVVLAYGLTEIVTPDARSTHLFIPSRSVRRSIGRAALWNEPPGEATRAMLHSAALTFTFPCSVVVRRAVLEEIGGFRRVAGLPVTDYPTFLALGLRGRFSFVDRVMGYWRRHPFSSTWSFRRQFDRALPDFALRFLEEHGSDWDPSVVRAIRRSWAGWADFLEGRALLLEGRWRESRICFLRTLRHGRPLLRAAAVLGYLCSYVHRDLEAVIRLSGRIDARSTGIVPSAPAR